MRREWILFVFVVTAMLTSGCVTNKKYQDALAEADSAKMELEKTRQQKNAMEQQVKTLKELNVKFGSEAQAARDELQRIAQREAETIQRQLVGIAQLTDLFRRQAAAQDLSRAAALGNLVQRTAWGRRAVRRFVAGDTIDAAVVVAESMRVRGFTAIRREPPLARAIS